MTLDVQNRIQTEDTMRSDISRTKWKCLFGVGVLLENKGKNVEEKIQKFKHEVEMENKPNDVE